MENEGGFFNILRILLPFDLETGGLFSIEFIERRSVTELIRVYVYK